MSSIRRLSGVVQAIALAAGLAFVGPAIGTNYLFGRKSGKLFAIDAGYWLVFYAAMGLVFALLGA